jgi:hypothetical protein
LNCILPAMWIYYIHNSSNPSVCIIVFPESFSLRNHSICCADRCKIGDAKKNTNPCFPLYYTLKIVIFLWLSPLQNRCYITTCIEYTCLPWYDKFSCSNLIVFQKTAIWYLLIFSERKFMFINQEQLHF